MIKHNKYNYRKFMLMSKEDKLKSLVDELNAISEDIYKESLNSLVGLGDTFYHFYLEKDFSDRSYTILRDVHYQKREFKPVAYFEKDKNKALEGLIDISSEQQQLLMNFILHLDE